MGLSYLVNYQSLIFVPGVFLTTRPTNSFSLICVQGIQIPLEHNEQRKSLQCPQSSIIPTWDRSSQSPPRGASPGFLHWFRAWRRGPACRRCYYLFITLLLFCYHHQQHPWPERGPRGLREVWPGTKRQSPGVPGCCRGAGVRVGPPCC